MGIELSSFRTAVAGDGQWLSVQSGNMSKVVGSAEKQAIDVSDLSAAQKTDDLNKAANNIYMRGQLLEGIRSSLSGMDQTNAVKDFLANAEKTLFGELEGKQYGVGTASQDLSSATVKDLLSRLDGLTGTATVKFESKGEVQVGEWQMVDLAEEDMTTAQKDLHEKCPDATGKQRSALINLDRAGLAKCLGLSGSAAKQLQVQSVSPSEIEGFLECSVSGPNNQTYDVLVDQAGVFFNKATANLDKAKVEQDYNDLGRVMDAMFFVPSGTVQDVAKSFAYSDIKTVKVLMEALKELPADYPGTIGNASVAGAVVNKLHKALDMTRALGRNPNPDLRDVVTTLWKPLGLSGSAPKTRDVNALIGNFANSVRRMLFDDCLNVMAGPQLRQNAKVKDELWKAVCDPDSDENEELVEKFGGPMGLRNFTQLIGHASNVTGVPYDLHMKCLRDPSFHVNAGDFFVLPKPDKTYRVNVSLPKVIHDAVISERMKGFHFSLNGRRFYSACGSTSESVTQETFTDPLRAQGFSDLQIAQLADFANEAGTGVMNGLGMPSSSSVGVMDIRKDEHGNMKVRCQLASTRFNGVDLAPEDQRTGGAAFNFSLVTSTDDLVEEFTIRPDGKGTMDSIHFVQSDRPRNVVTVVDDTNRKVDREDIYGKEE